MYSSTDTLDIIGRVLSGGPSGLGTKTTSISAILSRKSGQESDTELRHRLPYRVNKELGAELNERLLSWAASINLYEGHLDYLRKCNFGDYVVLTYAFCEDRERLFLAGQAMLALFGLDDYFVDDKRSGATLDMVGRNLALCMSAIDVPYLDDKYNADTAKAMNANPIFVALRQYIAKIAKYSTPQQVARVRHEDLCLFVAMCQEASWRMNKHIAPVWEYLGGRQQNGFTPCLAMIDIIEGYELPHNIYSLPEVRRVIKIVGLLTVIVNDLVSSEKEEEADVYQFGIREAIVKEEGCSFEEAHRMGVKLHNELMRNFEDESAKLMVFASPELRKYLVGLEAWIAGNYRWHMTSERYTGK